MKHLKLYENKGTTFGLFTYIDTEDHSNNLFKIFDDLESAKNYYIVFVNDIKYDRIFTRLRKEMNTEDYITTYEEAKEFVENELYSQVIECQEITNNGKYELSEEYNQIIAAKKYNL